MGKKQKKQLEILVIGRDFEFSDNETRSLTSKVKEVLKIGSISTDTLKSGLTNITKGIGEALNDINLALSNYELNEITVKLEVSATGQVAILGNGLGVTGLAGIELKFVCNNQ